MTRLIWLSCLFLVWIVGSTWIPSSAFGEAQLEITRPDFQKIPIHIMDFANVESRKEMALNTDGDVVKILKADLTRSQVFSVVDLPLTKGKIFGQQMYGTFWR